MRFRIPVLIIAPWLVPLVVSAQPVVVEPPEFPSSVPGPSAAHDGSTCFWLASGAINPGDVEWVRVAMPFPSTRTVVDVDITSASGRSALLAAVVGGVTRFNMADSNNVADGLCGLGAGSNPVGSPLDSVGDVGATLAGAVINIGVTGAGDSGFTGNHSHTFQYDVWVYAVRTDPDCTLDSECADTVDCTVDRCNPTNGMCENTTDHDFCNDDFFCNGTERCNSTSGCVPGAAPCPQGSPCDEENNECGACTDDSDCDDGLFCNGQEQCFDGFCEDGPGPDCDDGIECTIDFCDPEAIECVHRPDDSQCDDGAYCNGAETCDPELGCQAGTAPCVDGVECTTDRCDESTDVCAYVPNDTLCDNGVFCDGAETCDPARGCRIGATPCDDHVECTDDECDEEGNQCKNVANDDHCDDLVACTVDRCDTSDGTCHHFPVDAQCDDGLFCNGAETCDALFGCRASVNPCPPSVRCNERRDVCVNCQNNAQCNDGVFCNGQEKCVAGTCQPGTPPKCDDGVECTVDSCNSEADRCEHARNDRSCDDGDFCNGRERCHPRNDCQPGPRRCRGGKLPGSN